MKYLSNYIEEKQTKAFDTAGAFFAFGQDQFNESKKDGVKYCDMGGGMVCPIDTARELRLALDQIYMQGIAQDIEENGLPAIILRELYNHEAFYTGNIDSTFDAIRDYTGITREMVAEIYKQNYNKND
jgi:hypothetical protein